MAARGLTQLPLSVDLEAQKVLKALPTAHAALAELKGIDATIPNHNILINVKHPVPVMFTPGNF